MWEWWWWALMEVGGGHGIALHAGHPLYSRENTVAGMQSATPPHSIPWPSPPRCDVGLWPTILNLTPPRWGCLHLAAHNPVAAASNPSPCTSPPPPPPPLTAGNGDGGVSGAVAAAVGMAAAVCREQWYGGNDGGGTPVLPLCISVLYFTSMQ
ncbi:hypothetical protein EDB86DRAFT_2922167 [Lactarius hatsudake]|nr:hypothetical protein EDB86DRAFT_2922167 [Lactarius hatsudake]